jgi:predicted PurR-regulated permease PerM
LDQDEPLDQDELLEESPPAERATGLYSGRVRDIALLMLTGLAFYMCWLVVSPFFAAITWALALAVAAWPLQCFFEKRFRATAAALLSLLAVAVVLVAPGIFVLHNAIKEAGSGIGIVSQNLNSARLEEFAGRYPRVHKAIAWLTANIDLNQEMKRAAAALATQASEFLSGSISVMTEITIMFVTLFFFLRDHQRLLQYLRQLLPLSADEADHLLRRLSSTIFATLYGNVAVTIVQGTLGGVMFWYLDLPAPVLWGVAMSLAGLLPMVGTAFIWGPAAILLLIQGSWVKALVLAGWGTFVIGLIDNVLRPLLVGRELGMHTLGIVLSVFGGLIVFGPAGIVLGPVVLALMVSLLEVWRLRNEAGFADSAGGPGGG